MTMCVYLKPACYWRVYVLTGKGGRLYPAYGVSGSEGEDSSPRASRRTPVYQQPAGLSDTPTSDNASDATLTDSELALARDSTLLVHNGKYKPLANTTLISIFILKQSSCFKIFLVSYIYIFTN